MEELIPTGWQIASIGEVTLPIEKTDPSRNPNQVIDYLDISGIDNKSNRIVEAKHYLGKDAPSRARQLIKREDILFSTVRTYLKNIAMVPVEYDGQVASTGFSILRAAEGISSKFLFYYTLTQDFLNPLTELQRGSSYPAVRDDDVRIQKIPIAPYNEQKRIGAKIDELFSELDKGIESLKTAREQLKVYRQAVLKHAFEGNLTAHWREQNKDKLESADRLLKRIKREREAFYQQQLKEYNAAKAWEANSKKGKRPTKPAKPSEIIPVSKTKLINLPALPFGWTYVQVSNLCEVVRGGSPRPAGDLHYYDGNIPFLKVADITRNPGAYLDSYVYTIKEAGLTKTRLISPKILLLSNSGATLGVPKICLIKATFNDGIAAFLGLTEESLLYHYYFWFSKTRELRGINQGAAQPNLNTDLIKEICIPICSTEEMQLVSQQIEVKLSVCDQLENEIEANLQKSEALRQSILKKAFSGKLVAQDPNDEPASVLLERIRAEKEAQKTENKKPKAKREAA